MNGGVGPKTGRKLLPQEKDLWKWRPCRSSGRLTTGRWPVWSGLGVSGEHCIDYAMEEMAPDAFCSRLVEGCLKQGQEREGGRKRLRHGDGSGDRHHWATAAAIQELVFRKNG